MRDFASWSGRIRLLALLCLLVAAGPTLLMVACGTAAAPQPEGTAIRGTPVPTIGGTIGGCELGPKADCPGADFSKPGPGRDRPGLGAAR